MIVVSFTILLCAFTIKAKNFTLPQIDAVSIQGGGMIALAQQWPKLWLLTQIYERPLKSIFQNQIPVTSCSGGSWFVDAIIYDENVARSFDADVDTRENFMEKYKTYFENTSSFANGSPILYLYKAVLKKNGWKRYNKFLTMNYNDVIPEDLNFTWNCEATLKTEGQRGTYVILQDPITEELFDETDDNLLSIPIIQKAAIKNNIYTAQDTEVVANNPNLSVTIKHSFWKFWKKDSKHNIPKSNFADAVKNEYTANLKHHVAASSNYIAGQLLVEQFSGNVESIMKWALAHSSCYATVNYDNDDTFQATVLDCGLYDYKALIPNVRDIQADGTLLLLQKEDLSSITEWYATKENRRKMYVFDVDPDSKKIVDFYTQGNGHIFNIWKWSVTTVENKFWGIPAGKRFDIIIPHLKWKDQDLCEAHKMGIDVPGILECGNAFMSTYFKGRKLSQHEPNMRDV